MRLKAVTVGLIAVMGLLLAFSYSSTSCQNYVGFTTEDRFKILSSNGSIRFAFNGTYLSATQDEETWQFNDLMFNGTQQLGNFKISAENSNITIFSYRAGNLFLRSARLTYAAEGNGNQIINFCFNNTQPTKPSEWSVITTGSVFLAEGNGWKLLPDDSVVVSGIVGNITVVHYNFQMPETSDQPFYVQHSVSLASAVVLAATVAVAGAIKYREK